MSERGITRRSLLVAGAGALAGAGLRAGRASAATPTLAASAGVAPPPRVAERPLGTLAPAAVTTVALAGAADLLGVSWQAPRAGAPELRFRTADGGWSAWVSAAARGHGPDGRPACGAHVGEPLWSGGTRELQLRSARRLTGVRLHTVDVSGGIGARALAAASAGPLPLAQPQLAAGPGQPPIIARRAWAGVLAPRVAPAYGAVRLAFVHHTQNPNGYAAGEVPAMLRAIYAFHRYVNGWNDIGYNFVVDLYGRIFEARAGGVDEPVVGAQAGGYNLASTGVAVLGSFMSTPPSAPARAALARLLAWKLALHGVPATGRVTVRVNPAGAAYSRFPANARVSLPRIAGHRDADSTDCPGDVLYSGLPAIRAGVRRLSGRPARLTLALASAPPPAPAPQQPGSPSSPPAEGAQGPLVGSLSFLDGSPIAGASVLVQARSVSGRGLVVRESTIAQPLTDGQGRFAVPGPFLASGGTTAWLRALWSGVGGAGATVSEPLRVGLPAPLSPPPAPAPSSPAPAPPGP